MRRRRNSAAFKAEEFKVSMQLAYRLLRRWIADHETQEPDAVTPSSKPMTIDPADFGRVTQM